MQVSAPLVAQRPPWLRVSQRIAGVCENYCPILCRRLVGPHPSSVGVPHIGVNALLSAGAAITVRGGATPIISPTKKALFSSFQGVAKDDVTTPLMRIFDKQASLSIYTVCIASLAFSFPFTSYRLLVTRALACSLNASFSPLPAGALPIASLLSVGWLRH